MKKLNKIGLLFLLAVSFLLAGMSTRSWADKTHIVKKGDSLYKISKKYKTDIEALAKANELVSNKLALGTKLVIPSKETDKEASSAEIGTSLENRADKSTTDNLIIKNAPHSYDNAGPKIYEVRQGDSLWKIARKFSISVDELKKLNNLKSRKLKLAQKLIIDPQPQIMEVELDAPLVTLNNPDPVEVEEIKELSETPEPGNSKISELLMFVARQTIGIPYKFGSSSTKSTDCSGYVQRVFSFLGIQLPRSAREQYTQGVSVNKDNLSIGDLVFFRTYASFPSHVGIYLGNNLFIHASSFARKVTIDRFNAPYYVKRFIGAKRLQRLDEISVADSPKPIE